MTAEHEQHLNKQAGSTAMDRSANVFEQRGNLSNKIASKKLNNF